MQYGEPSYGTRGRITIGRGYDIRGGVKSGQIQLLFISPESLLRNPQ